MTLDEYRLAAIKVTEEMVLANVACCRAETVEERSAALTRLSEAGKRSNALQEQLRPLIHAYRNQRRREVLATPAARPSLLNLGEMRGWRKLKEACQDIMSRCKRRP